MKGWMALIVACCGVSMAQPPQPPELRAGAALDAYMDGMFAALMESEHVPGAVCSIVQGDEVIFAKGYGLNNVAENAPIDPATTEFEVASISKLFTGTAVMQHVEAGKLDLDADVNQYLKGFQIPDTYPQPVTLKHLLTHTAGFTENSMGMGQREPLRPEQRLGDFLAAHMPPRVRPPGVLMSYSNYGVSLCGYIVECVTGEDFAEYVEKHILSPLGMERSSFRRGEAIATALAKPYQFRGGDFVEKINNYTIDYPAGAMATTALDMTRFMRMHLNEGAWNGTPILRRETAQRMHTQQFTHDPRLPGMAIAFFEERRNGHRALLHDGYLRGFASLCYLMPDDKVGVFISNNGDSIRFWRQAIDQFLDYYYPAPAAPSIAPPDPAAFRARMAPFEGTYRPTRHAAHTIEKLGVFLDQVGVRAKDNGTVTVAGARTRHFREMEPLLFAETHDETAMAFLPPGEDGRAHMIVGGSPAEKLAWWETFPVQAAYLAALLTVLLSAIVLIPWLRIREMLYPSPIPRMRARWADWLAWMMALLFVMFMVSMIVTLTTADTYEFIYGVPTAVKVQVGIGQVAVVVMLLSLALLPGIWRNRLWRRTYRMYHTLVIAAGAGLLPFMAYWNLLGFRW